MSIEQDLNRMKRLHNW